MNILFVAAEVAPFATVGGLSQVMYFLPRALKQMGHDVRIFTPKYGTIDQKNAELPRWKFTMAYEGLRVPIGETREKIVKGKDKDDFLICNVKYYRERGLDPHIYFLENREYYELRANVFGYGDDHVRFGLLSRGCLEFLYQLHLDKKRQDWFPDIIHCHDWHTGYLIDWMRRDKRYASLFAKIPSVLTVHNFAYQGNFDFRFAPVSDKDLGLAPLKPLLSAGFQKQNALLRAIRFADGINTVSPTHAVEVLQPEFAEGLQDELIRARGKLIGILNGLDTKEFNPATDPIIAKKYTEKTVVSGKRFNKIALQKRFLLPQDPDVPVIISIGRLSTQKGWDLLLTLLPHVLAQRPDLQFIALGSSDQSDYRERLLTLQKQFPLQIGLHLRGDFRLPRILYAGGDMMLIPSKFEPGGIVALEALRYGVVSIVRQTGGLRDIITDFDPEACAGNGFSFSEHDPWTLFASITEGLTFYKQKTLWKKLVQNCMLSDFSWRHAAKEYDSWYEQIVVGHKRALGETPHPAYEVTV
jgi:starch synthase